MKRTCSVLMMIAMSLTGCSEQQSSESVIAAEIPISTQHIEDFEGFPFSNIAEWRADPVEYQGPYSEAGEYYQAQNIVAPSANRNTVEFGDDNWLSAEIYTRTESPILLDYIDTVPDPDDPTNQVLKVSTPDHTDGVVLRSRESLPPSYKISLRIGHAQYGDETPLNGYNDGNERAGPWRDLSAVGHNGFYWLAILDSPPKPHNNIWIHHHRKFVIDSWNRKGFHNTVNVIALDGRSETHEAYGKKFISYVDGKWQNISDVPVDFYLPNEWYTLTFTRTPEFYEFSISGNFKNGGNTTYTERINLAEQCVFHYNQNASELDPSCIDYRRQNIGGKDVVAWPKLSAYPEYFMLGEPHINYYEGSVLIDDISLEVL